MGALLGAPWGTWPPAVLRLRAASSAPLSVAFGPFAIRMFTGHSNYAHVLAGSSPFLFYAYNEKTLTFRWVFCHLWTMTFSNPLGSGSPFFEQVAELAFFKRSTTKKPFRFSTSLYIFYYIAQSVSIDFVGFSLFNLSMMQGLSH